MTKDKSTSAASTDPLRLEQQVCFALYRASRSIIRAYTPLLEKLGITYPQYLVLLVLWEKDQITVGEIGERLQLDSATLTPLLKRMETAGFLHRTRDHRDERVVIIHLTEQGYRLKNRATKIPEQLACHLGFDTADPDTVKAITQLKALLARF